MKKVILKVLIVISISIILLGIFVGKNTKDQIRNEGMPTENVYIDGNDATEFIEVTVEIGSALLGVVIIIFSVLAVTCIWVVYGIILLTIFIVKKIKSKRTID